MALPQTIDRLQDIQADIWEQYNGYATPVPRRLLSTSDFDEIFNIADIQDLPVRLHKSCVGSDIGFSVFNPANSTVVIEVGSGHLGHKKASRFDDLWAIITPHTHSSTNLTRLSDNGLSAPGSQNSYN